MPPKLLIDLESLDLENIRFDKDAIRRNNPHRHEFELLDSIVHFDAEKFEAVAFHDLSDDAFWVRGHIPGHPLFPGALMVESAAQLCSFCYHEVFGVESGRFFGFGGIDKVSFRGSAEPGQRFWVACRSIVVNRRRSVFQVQSIQDGKVIFDGQITGVMMPVRTAEAAT